MQAGDLVRPKAIEFREQVGVVLAVGIFSALVLRLCGKQSRYNKGALEVISER
jgi:hypothetical protein